MPVECLLQLAFDYVSVSQVLTTQEEGPKFTPPGYPLQLSVQQLQQLASMSHPKGLSIGEWRQGQGIVRITQQRGKHWSTHGHVHEGATILLPEEALFLMECGALEIHCESKSLTLQEAYHSLLSQSTLQFYQVLASLKRIGFIAYKVYLLQASAEHTLQPLQSTGAASLSTVSACPLCTPVSSGASGSKGTSRLVLLEVYKPRGSTPFRKSDPGPPDFRVMIARPGEEFPSAERVKALSSIQPPCPFRVCVVDGASLTHYTLTPATKQSQPIRTTQQDDTQ